MGRNRRTISWTKEQTDFIRDNYKTMKDPELTAHFNDPLIKAHSVASYRKKLGFVKFALLNRPAKKCTGLFNVREKENWLL